MQLRVPSRICFMPLAALLLVGSAASQGGDDCSSATALTGEVFLVMDTLTAGDSGFQGGAPCDASSSGFQHDRFFQWTAPTPGDYAFFATGVDFGDFDPKVAIFEGVGCAATCVQSSDDPTYRLALANWRAT